MLDNERQEYELQQLWQTQKYQTLEKHDRRDSFSSVPELDQSLLSKIQLVQKDVFQSFLVSSQKV
jgi:hypothetical protein